LNKSLRYNRTILTINMWNETMTLEEQLAPYDYDLPEECIAVHPLPNRADSKMLVLTSKGTLEDSQVSEILNHFESGDVLVLNNTKVLHARVAARRMTGGAVEVFFLHQFPEADGCYRALVKPSRRLKEGEVLSIEGLDETLTLVSKSDDGEWRVEPSLSADEVMKQVGDVPIPPYLRRQSDVRDQTRYQTVFAKKAGAVAAPTAGLHFTPELLSSLEARGVSICYVTLHVGIGTFRNLRAEDLENNRLHSEWYSVPAQTIETIRRCKGNNGNIFACGTTVTRTLESAYLESPDSFAFDVDNPLNLQDIFPISGYTNIFIREGFTFQVVDGLLTNFHLPKSSLLMLVSALVGREKVLAAYRHAIENNYRFFSYGDAMLITPKL